MQFAQPYWLVAGVVVVMLLVAVLARAEHLRSRAITLLSGARLRLASSSQSRARRLLRLVVITLAVAMGFVALARPRKGMHWETIERSGVDLLLVVDTSRSMDADDVKPTRLERSKLAIRDLVQRFPGDRIGLVAFAGDAFVESPMTLDHSALLESVDALDTGVIGRGGTNIGRGIEVAAGALASEPARQKIMVVLSDGEDLEGQGLAEARAAASAGITIDTVGVGTSAGELVPARDAQGRTVGLMRDLDGKVVRSHLDEAGLKAIADATHGVYRPLGVDGRGLDKLYDESLSGLTRTEASSRTRRVYSERFELPLALALCGILLESLLSRRWREPRGARKRARARSGRSATAVAAALLLLTIPTLAQASVETAAKAYAAGHFDDAANEFQKESAKNPKDARLAFNAGDAAYRAGHYDVAEAAFKSALASADPRLQQRVLYNEGDVLYRAGEAQKPEARDETIAKWKAAIEAYDGALGLDAKDADARFNRDFVQRKLKALEEQKKQDPKKQDQEKQGSQKKDQDQQAAKGGSKSDKDSAGSQGKSEPKSGGKQGKQDSSAKGDTHGEGSGGTGQPDKNPGGQAAGTAPGNGKGEHSPDSAGQKREAKNAGSSPTPGQPAPPLGGQGEGGSDERNGAQPGRLSPRDARSLLGALRGDERRGVLHAASGTASEDDLPRKDW